MKPHGERVEMLGREQPLFMPTTLAAEVFPNSLRSNSSVRSSPPNMTSEPARRVELCYRHDARWLGQERPLVRVVTGELGIGPRTINAHLKGVPIF